MALKRLFDSEIIETISSKHPRYLENDDRNMSPLNVSSLDDIIEKPHLSGNHMSGEDYFDAPEKPVDDFGHANREDSKICNVVGDNETVSFSPCVINNTCEEHSVHELVFHLPFATEYFYFDCSVRHLHNDNSYNSMLNSTSRKLIPVGPAHQADIPELSESIHMEEKKDELGGICIIPCRELDEASPTNNVEAVDDRAENCTCPDLGSTRCVQKHITEAREKLKGTVGAEAFKELGFYEMGDVVADKWSEEDEVLFHKVVHSNPASSGKNFWNILRLVFPSQTHMKLVSYYFNVLILRKRAAQNRYDQTNIDSDDDEWTLTEDNEHVGTEGRKTDERDDSAVDSGSDALACYSDDDAHGLDEHVDDSSHQSYPGRHLRSHEHGKDCNGHSGDNDVQDGSCTSFDYGSPAQVPAESKGDHKDWSGSLVAL